MTNAELLAVALRAHRYPRRHAQNWGYCGRLAQAEQSEVERLLRENPALAQYG